MRASDTLFAVAKRVLVPLPDRDFDPTESAVPWHALREAGHEVVFATAKRATPACDPLLITGVLFGQLGAKEEPKRLYLEMEKDPAFAKPIAWSEIDPARFDALVLPGGHAPGMKQYLAGETLHEKVAEFARTGKPVGAICHGVLVLARARDRATGKSPLHERRTTCLPKYMERTAYLLTAWKLGRYYRTYDAYVEDEVKEALRDPSQFERGPFTLTSHGTAANDEAAFVVEDDTYVSARWPGDAFLFAKKIVERL
jgi:putative intracellular protease/amidase